MLLQNFLYPSHSDVIYQLNQWHIGPTLSQYLDGTNNNLGSLLDKYLDKSIRIISSWFLHGPWHFMSLAGKQTNNGLKYIWGHNEDTGLLHTR